MIIFMYLYTVRTQTMEKKVFEINHLKVNCTTLYFEHLVCMRLIIIYYNCLERLVYL